MSLMVSARYSGRPLVAMTLGVASALGVAACLQRVQDGGKSGITPGRGALSQVKVDAEQQQIGEMCEQAIYRLETGDDEGAYAILATIASRPLILLPGGMGSGVLQHFSPTTIFMRLARTLANKAELDAASGKLTEAREHIALCRTLSAQLLKTPQPTLAALDTAHYFDQRADMVENRVFPLTRPTHQQMMSRWRGEIQGAIMQWRNRWDTAQVSDPGREASEAALATRLMDQYRTYRREVDTQTAIALAKSPALAAVAAVSTPRPVASASAAAPTLAAARGVESREVAERTVASPTPAVVWQNAAAAIATKVPAAVVVP